ncbi:hypothetical protein ABTX82_01680 [Streptomyces lavendulae]|uniref:hypothetical protein n=1 Tax=Streptomyces lavendulae TaxID=1914 RepID=UPI003332633C
MKTATEAAREYAAKSELAIRRSHQPGVTLADREAALAEAQVWATLALAAATQPRTA